MIDWSKIGPASAPGPSTPETTAPVAPAAPGGMPSIPTVAAPTAPYQTGSGFHPATQAQVDAMDPGQRLGRGIDFLGETLFGRGNGSPLGGVPLLGDIVGAVGNVAHGIGTATVVKPIEAGATVASHIPLGWLPGGADENFNAIGDWAKQNNPAVYQQWQSVNAAASGDILGGGNMKADFNVEVAKMLDDTQYNSSLGTTPTLALGRVGVGSVGGAFAHAIEGFLGLGGNTVQRGLGAAGITDPDNLYRNRVQESAARLDAGGEVSDVEKKAVEAFRSGLWSEEHAQDYIVSHGQGLTRNIIGQVLGSVITDPLTYATLGAGSIAKAGQVGARIGEAGAEATTVYEKLATTVAAVQKSELGPAFRLARGMVDPLAVYKPSTVQRAVTDLFNGVAISSFGRAYGEKAVQAIRKIGREFGMTDEVDSAVASYSIDQGSLMVARKAQRDILAEGLGEDMVHSNVDDVIKPMMQNAARDAETELTDHMMGVAKNTFTAEEEASLAGRMAATFGNDVPYWEKRLAGMSFESRSALHAVTYKRAEVAFEEARAAIPITAYAGDLPLNNMVLMTTDTLDNVTAEGIISNLTDVLKDGTGEKIAMATDEWNAQARRFPAMANMGYATGGQEQVKNLIRELDKTLQSGGLSRRALEDELSDPALASVKNMLDRNTVEGKPLWNVGFRPDEEVAWGLKRDANTGRYVVDRDPTISHVVDAVPGRQPFSDTTRNVLGQIIGKSGAERVNQPIESIEAFVNTARDVVTGRRLVANIEKRFERSTFDAGIPKPISKEIFTKAREVAGLDYTTVRGIKPANLWNEIHDIIPRDLVLKDGSHLNVHIVMDHLLQAAEGDLRVMGVTSVLSQRMRNALRAHGDGANWAGQMTVTMYNKLRYSQPMFLIQRVTDAPYYSILYGVTPVGKAALKGENAATRVIEENLGRTGLARDFSMDMPEYATRSNFTQGIKSAMQEKGLESHKLEAILRTPDAIIANNMTNMLTNRWGDIVKGSLDNLATIAEKDPALKAEMMAAGEQFQRTFADIRRVYSDTAGRVLDDNEVGLRYAQDMLNGWRRHVVNADGTLDFSRLIAEGERSMPADIADIGTIKPDILAQELGYADSAALRRDVTGHIEKINGEFVLVKGEHDVPWLEERLRETLGAHPDYTKRAVAYYSETWDDFWTRLSRGTDQGGLDISAHYAREAQDLIANIARERGMDPWEYLSGVMATNLGPGDLDTAMGRLVSFLKGGPAKGAPGDWGTFFRSHLDPSAQQTLVDEWGRNAGKSVGNAAVPEGFTKNPHVAASGHTFPPDIKREGIFHVTTAKDAVGKEGFKPSAAGEGATGFGSNGDILNKGRVSVLTDRARAQTYMDRMTIAVKAARGEASRDQIMEYFRPLYEKAFPGKADEIMSNAMGAKVFANTAPTPEESYYMVRMLDGALSGGNLTSAEKGVQLTAKFEDIVKVDPNQIGLLELATKEKAQVQAGIDMAELTLKPEDLSVLGTGAADTSAFFDTGIIDMLKARVAAGPHSNPDVESALQQISKLVQTTLKGTPEEAGTRAQLRALVQGVKGGPGPDEALIGSTVDSFYDRSARSYITRILDKDGNQIGDALTDGTKADRAVSKTMLEKKIADAAVLPDVSSIPTDHAAPFNRSQALVTSLLKDKIQDAQQDIFRLAEMQTKRTVLERSMNHPLFGLYPASYMWGKVLPETVKFLAKNPYAATYAIADVQRAIALQREYDREMDDKVHSVDRSAGAFLLDYLTPGLPWSDHSARLSPMVRDLLKGDLGSIWGDELKTVTPDRWIAQVRDSLKEIPGAVESLQSGQTPQAPAWQSGLQNLTGGAAAPSGSTEPSQITGPTKASALAGILEDDMSRLSSILLSGASPEK